jgi:hypothetical protein
MEEIVGAEFAGAPASGTLGSSCGHAVRVKSKSAARGTFAGSLVSDLRMEAHSVCIQPTYNATASLTVKALVRFSLYPRMRRLLYFLPVVALVLSQGAFAAPKGKPKPSPKPPAGAVKSTPNVKVNQQDSAPAAQADNAPAPTRGPTRIDFDDRLIQGQTNKSGAVYLYDRKELKTKSMIKTRDSFRDEIVGSLYDT